MIASSYSFPHIVEQFLQKIFGQNSFNIYIWPGAGGVQLGVVPTKININGSSVILDTHSGE